MEELRKTNSETEINALIYTTLRETTDSICKSLDELKGFAPTDYSDDHIEAIVEQTQQFVVFAKYCGDYLRRAPQNEVIREEMLKIKLHLLSVLRSLIESIKAGDRAAAHDLLTEELRDNLTLWKIKILPLLRPNRPQTSGSHRA